MRVHAGPDFEAVGAELDAMGAQDQDAGPGLGMGMMPGDPFLPMPGFDMGMQQAFNMGLGVGANVNDAMANADMLVAEAMAGGHLAPLGQAGAAGTQQLRQLGKVPLMQVGLFMACRPCHDDLCSGGNQGPSWRRPDGIAMLSTRLPSTNASLPAKAKASWVPKLRLCHASPALCTVQSLMQCLGCTSLASLTSLSMTTQVGTVFLGMMMGFAWRAQLPAWQQPHLTRCILTQVPESTQQPADGGNYQSAHLACQLPPNTHPTPTQHPPSQTGP